MLDDLPPFLTVEQAAKVLQLGRSKTYELTVEFDCSAGRSGCRSCGSASRSASRAPPSSASWTPTAVDLLQRDRALSHPHDRSPDHTHRRIASRREPQLIRPSDRSATSTPMHQR